MLRYLPVLLLPASVGAQAIDTARALSGLSDAATACAADHGGLWGRSLCGPVALVDRASRLVIANDTPSVPYLRLANAYVTALPPGRIIANTSFTWAGRPWTMVMLPLPADRFARTALVLHEAFHREQAALGLQQTDALNNHLDFTEGRTWLLLELRALGEAIRASTDDAARKHAEAALLFRARRRTAYPGSDSTEATLEIQEGLPEYTGQRLALSLTGGDVGRVAEYVSTYSARSFVRSFAYATGPGLGFVLDRLRPDWRVAVRERPDLSGLLADAVRFTAPRELDRAARQRAAAYGFAAVDSAERARDAARAPQMAEYRRRFVDGPTITFHQTRDSLSWGYDPTSLVALDLESVIYPFGTFNAPWGSVNVEKNGIAVRNDLSVIRVALSGAGPGADAREWQGDGWTATLKDGWVFAPDLNRPGSFVVRRR